MKTEEKQTLFMLICFILICTFISGAFSIIYKIDNERVKQHDGIENIEPLDETLYFCGYDLIRVENGNLIVSGWIAPKQSNLTYVNRRVLLQDEQGTMLELNTIAYDRGLTGYFNTGFDYTLGGIEARCPISQLTVGESYRVFFLLTEQDGRRYIYEYNLAESIEI